MSTNVILSHTPDCRMVGTRKVRSTPAHATKRSGTDQGAQYCGGHSGQSDVTIGFAGADGRETVERWECVPDCPVRMLDEQAGERTSGAMAAGTMRGNREGWAGPMPQQTGAATHGDSGGVSRFYYCAKSSTSERGTGNNHPCCKPLDLCRYLAKLILPPGDDAKLLIPFSGSGSEMIGAREAGWKHVTGIEMNAEYIEIAERRLRSRSEFGATMQHVAPADGGADLPLFGGMV